MPQSGIDEGETPEQAMWRELGEEVGTDKAEFWPRAKPGSITIFPSTSRANSRADASVANARNGSSFA